jgi:hypothetical protein
MFKALCIFFTGFPGPSKRLSKENVKKTDKQATAIGGLLSNAMRDSQAE